MKSEIDQSISKYTENYVEEPSPVNTLISHIVQYPTTTAKDQFSLLSSISNYHWVNNITLSTNHPQKKTFNRFMNHMLYHPDKNEQNTDHIPVPNSPRIRLMYMLTSEKYENTVGPHIKNYLDHDFPSQQPISENCQHDDYPQDENQPPKKKRKQSARLVTVNGTLLCNSMQLKYNDILNAAKKNRSLYVNFKEQLLSEGTLKWRFHS